MSDFDTFRRKLADAVTIAINSGTVVTADKDIPGAHCPLGCMPGASWHYPSSTVSAGVEDLIADDDLAEFVEAFDDGSFRTRGNPYAELGKLYRARFP